MARKRKAAALATQQNNENDDMRVLSEATSMQQLESLGYTKPVYFCRAVQCPGYDYLPGNEPHPTATCGSLLNGLFSGESRRDPSTGKTAVEMALAYKSAADKQQQKQEPLANEAAAEAVGTSLIWDDCDVEVPPEDIAACMADEAQTDAAIADDILTEAASTSTNCPPVIGPNESPVGQEIIGELEREHADPQDELPSPRESILVAEFDITERSPNDDVLPEHEPTDALASTEPQIPPGLCLTSEGILVPESNTLWRRVGVDSLLSVRGQLNNDDTLCDQYYPNKPHGSCGVRTTDFLVGALELVAEPPAWFGAVSIPPVGSYWHCQLLRDGGPEILEVLSVDAEGGAAVILRREGMGQVGLVVPANIFAGSDVVQPCNDLPAWFCAQLEIEHNAEIGRDMPGLEEPPDNVTQHPLEAIATQLNTIADELDVKPLHVMRLVETLLQTFGSIVTCNQFSKTSPVVAKVLELLESQRGYNVFRDAYLAAAGPGISKIIDDRIGSHLKGPIDLLAEHTRMFKSIETGTQPHEFAKVLQDLHGRISALEQVARTDGSSFDVQNQLNELAELVANHELRADNHDREHIKHAEHNRKRTRERAAQAKANAARRKEATHSPEHRAKVRIAATTRRESEGRRVREAAEAEAFTSGKKPLPSRGRGRPKGSLNKKTLERLRHPTTAPPDRTKPPAKDPLRKRGKSKQKQPKKTLNPPAPRGIPTPEQVRAAEVWKFMRKPHPRVKAMLMAIEPRHWKIFLKQAERGVPDLEKLTKWSVAQRSEFGRWYYGASRTR